ncbi:hypothetical protein BBW65_03535 [Helicobacter enhydrae]|uniref:Uncharacterized protein n=1 Tax=Helicobacter enhydrae TaxID=222136 RepID=A0A1B1U557_9HELI|nr:hypothetical protein [Helicobacter enhydrae]ANV97927.1 hypothetical protein BBW65_03535 [Helicobacter enhydrae]
MQSIKFLNQTIKITEKRNVFWTSLGKKARGAVFAQFYTKDDDVDSVYGSLYLLNQQNVLIVKDYSLFAYKNFRYLRRDKQDELLTQCLQNKDESSIGRKLLQKITDTIS